MRRRDTNLVVFGDVRNKLEVEVVFQVEDPGCYGTQREAEHQTWDTSVRSDTVLHPARLDLPFVTEACSNDMLKTN